jgi:hypothetical protein
MCSAMKLMPKEKGNGNAENSPTERRSYSQPVATGAASDIKAESAVMRSQHDVLPDDGR